MKTTMLDGEPLEVNEVAAKCKICGRELVLELAANYPADKDPMKLLPYATCDRCYDLRDRRIKIQESIKRLCYKLELGKLDDTQTGRILRAIEALTKEFSRYCTDLLRRPHRASTAHLVSAIMEQPTRWHYHLKDFEEAASAN